MSLLKQYILENIDTMLSEAKTDSEFTHVAHIEAKRKRSDMDGTSWGLGRNKKEADEEKEHTVEYEGMKRGPKTELYKVHKDAIKYHPEHGFPILRHSEIHLDHNKKEITLKK